jgi:hypothetical protein
MIKRFRPTMFGWLIGAAALLPGEIAGIDIERGHDAWLCEFRVFDRSGRMFEVYVDASSGDIKYVKEK